MRYLITTPGQKPFMTKWFDPENHFKPDVEMIVYDLSELKYTKDGVNWYNIEVDEL